MESDDGKGAAAERTRLIARLVNDVRAARVAGKSADDELIISAHPNLMPELREELLKLGKGAASRTGRIDSFSGDVGATRLPGAEPPETTAPAVEIAGYNILKELGRGGQAIVFLALQLSTGRKVAVKVTYEGPLADERSQARFNREVRALAALQHPNIVAILDTGRTVDGNRYIAMDYIAGCSLDEYMKYRHKKDPADPSKLLRMFLKICAAMNVAHSQHIIHRDLKPTNIRVDERGEPHILDFGLARSMMDRFIGGSDRPVSITGEFLGSIPWSSPEQAEGDPDKIDVRTDVYSLGVILYQMITGGYFPYEVVGNIRDVLNNILTANPTPPSKAARFSLTREPRTSQALPRHAPPVVNETLEKVVLKALAKKPEQRYQTAGELGRDIANYLAGERSNLRESAVGKQIEKPAARGMRPVAMIAVAAALLLCAAGYGGWHFWRAKTLPTLNATVPVAQSSPAPVATMAASLAPASALTAISPPLAKAHMAGDIPPIAVLHGRARLSGEDLCLTPIGAIDATFLFGGLNWSSYNLTFRAISNGEGAFNVIFHWTAPGNFYGFCPANVNNRFGDLFKRQEGTFSRAIGQIRFGRIEPDRWYDIRLEVRGSIYRCYVDGKEWFQTEDDKFTHGRVGLSVWNSNVRFHDIKVTAPDGTTMWSGPPDLSGLPRFAQDRSTALITPLARMDVLAQADPARDTLAGNWKMENGSLSSASGAATQIEFPYSPAGDYDYRINFIRAMGNAPMTLIFPVAGQMCDWTVSGEKPTLSGFASVDGNAFDNNHTTSHFGRKLLADNGRHGLVVAVRGHTVTAYVDGLQTGVLRTDQDHVTLDPSIAPPHGNRLGLRIGGDAVRVESADVLLVAAPGNPAAPATEPAKN
jgi:serine/threonine protein kinase